MGCWLQVSANHVLPSNLEQEITGSACLHSTFIKNTVGGVGVEWPAPAILALIEW